MVQHEPSRATLEFERLALACRIKYERASMSEGSSRLNSMFCFSGYSSHKNRWVIMRILWWVLPVTGRSQSRRASFLQLNSEYAVERLREMEINEFVPESLELQEQERLLKGSRVLHVCAYMYTCNVCNVCIM